jgi:hypothetical protein
MASEQAFCEPVFGMETASQAEYAGSIPVIGSTLTSANATESARTRMPIPRRYPDLRGRDRGGMAREKAKLSPASGKMSQWSASPTKCYRTARST